MYVSKQKSAKRCRESRLSGGSGNSGTVHHFMVALSSGWGGNSIPTWDSDNPCSQGGVYNLANMRALLMAGSAQHGGLCVCL